MSMAILLAFAGASFAQTTATGVSETTILRGTSKAKRAVHKPVPKIISAKSAIRKPAAVQKAATVQKTAAIQKAATVQKVAAVQKAGTVQKAATVQKVTSVRSMGKSTVHHVTPQSLRGSRYGGFAPSAPVEPPVLDTTSPRSLTMTNVNSGESISVTYWSDGTYHRDALDKLNHFLRDVKTGEQTEMDPLLFDVLWHTIQITGFHGTVEVLSGYRSPETNAWLASVSAGVARDSQHMNGNAMDIRFPGVPVLKIRQAARSLQMGGVGFYPRSGFVHLDTGPVRYW
ncbi:MAG: DUF882 domain-containing protein [Proteobacteria bacterium]|nr:DUF882 domain-containing protein [Pseudomonadota bacterium]